MFASSLRFSLFGLYAIRFFQNPMEYLSSAPVTAKEERHARPGLDSSMETRNGCCSDRPACPEQLLKPDIVSTVVHNHTHFMKNMFCNTVWNEGAASQSASSVSIDSDSIARWHLASSIRFGGSWVAPS
eukprot:gnl/TRDRNA2_/TRDRNA2_117434_c1_seq2.p1 gnl/TRDRNA2_/TRDRNA2_117434_c1~~gnl/TRDRNA2_/TRDRNA2_117434_c1_seq2.p1  ORF type:complete len:129 (-),score=2.10 gnl/TRDRNA2_/TRDRNA2_117434_c1_seq2:97-483(-)